MDIHLLCHQHDRVVWTGRRLALPPPPAALEDGWTPLEIVEWLSTVPVPSSFHGPLVDSFVTPESLRLVRCTLPLDYVGQQAALRCAALDAFDHDPGGRATRLPIGAMTFAELGVDPERDALLCVVPRAATTDGAAPVGWPWQTSDLRLHGQHWARRGAQSLLIARPSPSGRTWPCMGSL